jgi:MoxR-like ATPase
MSEGQLTGRLLPVGDGGRFEYVRSEFVRCYEDGGVFLFDEIDAADSNTLLVLNSALANGQMALANRPENPVAKKHPDFVAVAAANTFGTGADRQYVGRNQLDESTLDRFRIGQVEMDYDAEVEKSLCPDDGLRMRLQGYRDAIRANRLRRVVSTRFLRDAFVMKQAGDTDADIDAALFAGWSADEVRKVKGT